MVKGSILDIILFHDRGEEGVSVILNAKLARYRGLSQIVLLSIVFHRRIRVLLYWNEMKYYIGINDLRFERNCSVGC